MHILCSECIGKDSYFGKNTSAFHYIYCTDRMQFRLSVFPVPILRSFYLDIFLKVEAWPKYWPDSYPEECFNGNKRKKFF